MTPINEPLLKTDRIGCLRYTLEQKKTMVDTYRASGLSTSEPTRQPKALAMPTHFDLKLMQLLDDEPSSSACSIWRKFTARRKRSTDGRGAILAAGASTPFSPPSGPTQWLFQEPPAESKFLAARKQIPSSKGLLIPKYNKKLELILTIKVESLKLYPPL